MDYASIISHKLGKSWSEYNRLISVQVPLCPNNCWHCFLPKSLYARDEESYQHSIELTPESIVISFLRQREIDKNNGKSSNVLRITGGEPFLVPGLILGCLEEIKKKNLEKDVFLWTETNLEPFISRNKDTAFMKLPENQEILEKLKDYDNLVVHPCFHSLSTDNFNENTGKQHHISLGHQIEALKILYHSKIDIYPTFGINVVDTNYIYNLFNEIKKINPQLLYKVALIDYDLRYEPIEKEIQKRKKIKIYSKYNSLYIWNQLLLNNFGIGYGVIPRHIKPELIQKTTQNEEYNIKNEILYLFKASFKDLYHRETLDILGYPKSSIIDLSYDKKWVQQDLFIILKEQKDNFRIKEGVFIYADRKRHNLIPVRRFKIIKISSSEEIINLKLELGDYVYYPNETDLSMNIQRVLIDLFGKDTLPPSSEPTGKYMLIGESIFQPQIKETIFANSYSINLLNKIQAQASSNIDSFNFIVNRLSKLEDMKRSLFYRTIVNNAEQYIENNTIKHRIESGKDFSISIDSKLPNYDNFTETNFNERTINIESSSSNVSIIGPKKIVLSKYQTNEIYFKTNNINELSEESTITIWSEHNEFKAAQIVINITLITNRKKKAIANTVVTMVTVALAAIFANIQGLSSTLGINSLLLGILIFGVSLSMMLWLANMVLIKYNIFGIGNFKIQSFKTTATQ